MLRIATLANSAEIGGPAVAARTVRYCRSRGCQIMCLKSVEAYVCWNPAFLEALSIQKPPWNLGIIKFIGGFKPPEKYESQIGSASQLGEIIQMFQTTNQIKFIQYSTVVNLFGKVALQQRPYFTLSIFGLSSNQHFGKHTFSRKPEAHVVLTKNKIPLLKTNNKIIDDNHDP